MKRGLIAVIALAFMLACTGLSVDAASKKEVATKKPAVSAKKASSKAKTSPRHMPAKKVPSKKLIPPAKQPKAQKPQTLTVTKTISAGAANIPVPVTYRITSPTSASFSIGETLRGAPFTATGTTNDVSGTITLDRLTPSKTVLSPIKVNAQTFKTDSSSRDFMIRKFIFKADDAGN